MASGWFHRQNHQPLDPSTPRLMEETTKTQIQERTPQHQTMTTTTSPPSPASKLQPSIPNASKRSTRQYIHSHQLSLPRASGVHAARFASSATNSPAISAQTTSASPQGSQPDSRVTLASHRLHTRLVQHGGRTDHPHRPHCHCRRRRHLRQAALHPWTEVPPKSTSTTRSLCSAAPTKKPKCRASPPR